MNAVCTFLSAATLTLAIGNPASLRADSIGLVGSFKGTDGSSPFGSLIQIGSSLYGTTRGGGAYGNGTVFSIPVSGGSPTVLASFNGANGNLPRGGLIQIGDNLYGTTWVGGADDCGTVFSVPVAGGTPTVLTSFSSTGGSGNQPLGSLIQIGDTLYGTTSAGGAYGKGTVFSLPVAGGTATILTSFTGPNGSQPAGSLLQVGSTLYGTTSQGGDQDLGAVFSLPVSGGTPTVLASFNGSNGCNPFASLVLVGSTLYGTTQTGGINNDGCGVIFSVPIAGGAITDLGQFNGPNGSQPNCTLTLSSDSLSLYGTTAVGGSNNTGVIFSVPVSGGEITDLGQFNPLGVSHIPQSNGAHPNASMLLVGSTLYGTTAEGGTYDAGYGSGYGAVFSFNLPSIPEASSGLLVLLGILGFNGYRMVRRRKGPAA